MIRAAILALALSATPAMAQTQHDVEQTKGFILASFSRIYCGLAIPQQIENELRHLADKYNWNRYEFALIRECLERYPGAKVVGHRDLAATQCPGFDVALWWAGVQKKKKPEPVKVPSSAPVTTPSVGEDVYHIVERGETWYGIAAIHGVGLADLLALNDAAATDVLQVGRRLTVRKAESRTTSIDISLDHLKPVGLVERFAFWIISLFDRGTK